MRHLDTASSKAPRTSTFARAEDGAVAITFALISVVLFGLVAMAIDTSNFTRSRKALQVRLDEAALASARVFADNTADPTATAQAFFDAQWSRYYLTAPPTLEIQTERDNNSGDHIVKLQTTAQVKTFFAKAVGVTMMRASAQSEARVAIPFTEIALALDTTGSMSGTKLDDLKQAAKRLVEDIYDIPTARDRVKMSLVPFAQYVNVGMGNRNETWMDVPPDGSFWDANACWDHYPVLSQSNCRQTTCYYWNDGQQIPYSCQQCDTVYGPPERRCGANVTNVWNGCVGSRNYPMNMTPIADQNSRIPGIPNVQCGAPLMRLTNHQNQMRNAIEDMAAIGETYIPSGVEWAWRTLAPTGPFGGDTRPVRGQNSARKIMILMTDGANTRSPNYPDHEGWNGGESNQLTSEICQKAKTDGIEIFTVAFAVSDNQIKSILQQCAYNSSRYFDANNQNELSAVFRTISKQLIQTRLSK